MSTQLNKEAVAYTENYGTHTSMAAADGVGTPILEVKGLCKNFSLPNGGTLQACKEVCWALWRGESLGIVGESGSGKSTLMKMIMQMTAPSGGEIYLNGVEISKASAKEKREQRRKIQMVFQDSSQAFDPRMSVEDIICEPLYNFGLLKKGETTAIATKYLELVGLNGTFAKRYPHEMSGGQRQRVAIARALVLEPDIVVFDEATSALDVSVQDSIAKLLVKLQKEKNLTYLFVAHDIALIRSICHRVVVMYNGEVVEAISAKHLTEAKHPYTRKLLAAVFEVTEHRKPVVL